VEETGIGNAGDINITTGSLAVTGGGQLSASTGGEGKAGNVIINARDTVAFDGVGSDGFSSAAYSRVEEGAIGDGGNINITTGSLAVTGGAQISVSTGGEGLAGSVIITASDRVAFDGVGSNGISSGAYSRVEETGIGNGGDININTGSLSITNGAEGTVSNLGTDNAGNLVVRANSINLDNSGKLTAESVTGSGGNIHLTTTDLLLLRRNSLISALSGTSGSNGIDGNINIDTKFLIAVPKENSDIVATGFGRTPGSNIQVNAESIFGTQFRQQQTPESDIVASGTVKLNISYVDPNQGLVNLPGTLVDHTNQIAQGCSAGAANRENKFTVTGRGGLPQSPNEVLTPDMVQDDFGTPVASNPPTRDSVSPTPTSAPKQLVEAQGWVVNDLGVVTLVAAAPSVTPHSGALVPASCQIKGTTGTGDQGVVSSEELVPVR
jgi:large exoprotein involved in heme utilization and adhesion